MCGICGIVELRRPISAAVLDAMTERLRHRGPDDRGTFLRQPVGRSAGVGLGFRRLAIVDLVAGNQPLASEDGNVQVVCNGEIYNHRELRRGLVARGHTFATGSDCEVIVHLWEERGPAMLDALNGMFALAVWDARAQTLFLARDRFGKKPLHYAESASGLLFASEAKALLANPGCERKLDRVALAQYLTFDYVPAPRTAFAGIRKLPAGHALTWRDGSVTVEPWWQLRFAAEPEQRSLDAWAEEFLLSLDAAVRRRLMSDVPLGALLSGGIDSSAIVALMARAMPPNDVVTFSIGFDEPSYDESAEARAVAQHLGTDHYERILTARTLVDLLPEVFGMLDEPFADPSIVPTYLLCGFAREHVTVALGGDGGDELLAGYPTVLAERAHRVLGPAIPAARRLLAPLADALPPSDRNFSVDFKVRRFLRGNDRDLAVRHQRWLGSFSPEQADAVLAEPLAEPFAELRAADRTRSGDWLQRLTMSYVTTYLQDDILTKVDRASMAQGLEVRAPFLDRDLVDLVARMPSNAKLRGLKTKVVLRRAVASMLPSRTTRRPKKGFGIPIAEWFRTTLAERLHESLAPSRLRDQGLFEPAAVGRLVAEHQSGVRDHRKELWALFAFQQWHDLWLTSPRRALSGLAVAEHDD